MGTVHRFILVSILVLCSVWWPGSHHVVPRVTAGVTVLADAVVPVHVNAGSASAAIPDDCSPVAVNVRPFWRYLREFLVQHVRAVARWFSAGLLDVASPMRYRSPRENAGEVLEPRFSDADRGARRMQPAGRAVAATPEAFRVARRHDRCNRRSVAGRERVGDVHTHGARPDVPAR